MLRTQVAHPLRRSVRGLLRDRRCAAGATLGPGPFVMAIGTTTRGAVYLDYVQEIPHFRGHSGRADDRGAGATGRAAPQDSVLYQVECLRALGHFVEEG